MWVPTFFLIFGPQKRTTFIKIFLIFHLRNRISQLPENDENLLGFSNYYLIFMSF